MNYEIKQLNFLTGLTGSELRAKVLNWIFTHQEESYFVRQLALIFNTDSTNLSRELTHLEKLGILRVSSSGKKKYYQANSQNPLFFELCQLITKASLLAEIDPSVDTRFPISNRQLARFCRKHHIVKLSLFGSVLRDDFKPESDIDILVEFEHGYVPGFEIIKLEKELSHTLGRKVDLRTAADLSRYFRQEVIKEAKLKYDCTKS
jgi:predicted nucleotidyltransferase